MSAEWLKTVEEELAHPFGNIDKRRDAYRIAQMLEQTLPFGTHNANALSGIVRGMFYTWIRQKHHLSEPETLDHHLPATVKRFRLEIATEYGLSTAKATEAKEAWLDQARDRRITRCEAHLTAGWALEECVGFVCAKDEWHNALTLAGRVAA